MTKTYHYIYNGNPGQVDVTVNFTTCNIQSVGPSPFDRLGKLDIQVTLSESLPFDLILHFSVQNDFIEYGNSGTVHYPVTRAVPAGNDTYVFTDNTCYEENEDPYYRYDLTWSFVDQPEPQEVGGPLAAQVGQVTDATCFGSGTGSIFIEVEGGTGDYTFIWSDGGPDTPMRFSLPAGTYSVTVRDSNNDEVVLSNIVVGEPTQIQLGTNITPVSCNGGSNGAVSVTPSGGTAPYTFSWSDGSSQQNRTNLSAGNYTVTVVDANGCNRSFPVNIPQPAQITITVQQSGRDVVNVVTGGTTPYSFLWSDGWITKDRTNLASGTYTFTVTDANGCKQSTVIFVQDFKFFFSKNPIWLRLQAADPETKDNLSFICEVFLEEDYKSEGFDKKYESEHPSRVDGSTDFNVEQVLNSFLDSHVPVFADDTPRMVGEAFKRFYLRYYEKFGTPPEPSQIIQQETFYVLFGGLSEQEFAKRVFFDSYLDDQKPFLSWQPMEVTVSEDQHAYLHFVVVDGLHSSMTMRCSISYTDGTGATVDVHNLTDVEPYEVYRFPTGVGQMGLAALNPAKQISGYHVQLFSGANVLSENRSYKVVKSRKFFRKLLFLNSVGGWDSVLCQGRGKQSLRTSEETINRDLPVDFEYQDREEQTVSKRGQLTGSVVVANMNGYERRHLIELAISEKVYEQTASGYLPVQVKFDFDPQDDFENLDEISLDIIYPKIRRYTPEL